MGSLGHTSKISAFQETPLLLSDGIFDVTRRYNADTNPNKANLGQGSYRHDNGETWILPSVRMAKEAIADCDHEYLAVAGLKSLRDEVEKLVLGNTAAFKEGRVASVQSLSGSGALMLAGLTLKTSNTNIKTIYITDPTWPPHDLIFRSQGFEVRTLPYYKDHSFDFEAYMDVLKQAESTSAVVLHACAHNPTGCDPTRDQWRQIASVIRERGIFPIFDAAYLGFNTGSVDEDAWAIRYFIDDLGLEAGLCLSFAKSMGLYGERVGLVAFVTQTPDTARAVFTVLEVAQRGTVSTPPAYGAHIANAILGTRTIAEQWERDLITMSSRIRGMKQKLYDELVRLQTPGDWSHIVKATGMFAYLGLTLAQVEYLEAKHHIYMAKTSRISVAGLNDSNIGYFARVLDQTVRETSGIVPAN
ncbi:aspartate aminotransferase [Pseudomassariella vexata]|uniref:Aspartate aminotransferase n=1 Tax=Pseudomassariella vexata TaxID=1141098 RepID=A0A1Y2EFQ0_9PEZI|nr:aspartate aminotransferase [Pseudomassariella vexata]ORY70402.1 aspartate aminotransferase [Pseudomassariella vexata]